MSLIAGATYLNTAAIDLIKCATNLTKRGIDLHTSATYLTKSRIRRHNALPNRFTYRKELTSARLYLNSSMLLARKDPAPIPA